MERIYNLQREHQELIKITWILKKKRKRKLKQQKRTLSYDSENKDKRMIRLLRNNKKLPPILVISINKNSLQVLKNIYNF